MKLPATPQKGQMVTLTVILLLSLQVLAGQTVTSTDPDPTAQASQAAAAPIKIYLLAAPDYRASDVQRQLLEVPEFSTGSLVIVSNLAEADLVIQIGSDPHRAGVSAEFRIWSVPGEKPLSSGGVTESDGAKQTDRLVQEIMRDIEDVLDSPSAFKPRGPSTPVELQEYVQRARQELAKRLEVPEEQVQAKGYPILAPEIDRGPWAPPPLEWDNEDAASFASKTMVRLDAGLGNRICGHHRVLVSDDNVKLLDYVDKGDIEDALPITDEECRRVTEELDRFYEAATHVERGPDRFLPFLAKKVVTDLGHTKAEHDAPQKQKRQLFALFLDMRILAALISFEGLPVPEFEESPTREDEEEMADALKVFEPMIDAMRSTLSGSGALPPTHLSAIRPYMKQVVALGPVHKCPFENDQTDVTEGLRMPTEGSSYHLKDDQIYFYWIYESGRLKLFAAMCQA